MIIISIMEVLIVLHGPDICYESFDLFQFFPYMEIDYRLRFQFGPYSFNFWFGV